MGNDLLRTTPGCDLGCLICTIHCAVVVRTRDEIWDQVLRLRHGTATDDQVRDLALQLDELEDAERAVERVRPQYPAALPHRSFRAESQSAQLH